MDTDKQRRESILTQIRHFFEQHKGLPANWQLEIDALSPEDLFDELNIIIAHMCAPEWGGRHGVRSFLVSLGIGEEEAETLIADSCDFVF